MNFFRTYEGNYVRMDQITMVEPPGPGRDFGKVWTEISFAYVAHANNPSDATTFQTSRWIKIDKADFERLAKVLSLVEIGQTVAA